MAQQRQQERRAARSVERAIGPRRAGGRYLVDGEEVTVLAVTRDTRDWMVWSVTEADDDELAAGTSRTHCTRWEHDRPDLYRVIRDPEHAHQQ